MRGRRKSQARSTFDSGMKDMAVSGPPSPGLDTPNSSLVAEDGLVEVEVAATLSRGRPGGIDGVMDCLLEVHNERVGL